MISPQKIVYATYTNEDKDLICDVAFDSDNGEVSTFLSRDAIMSETYNGEHQRVSSYKYTEVLAPRVTFVDKNFRDITLDRQRDIMKWLTSKKTPSFLTVYINDPDNTQELVSYEILGNWTEINTYKLGNGRVVGFTAVFTSITPWAFSGLQTKTFSDTLNLAVNTDDQTTPIMPKITIKFNDSNEERLDVKIQNVWTDMYQVAHVETMKITNNTPMETIFVDGANKVISSSLTYRQFGDDFEHWKWLPLYDGNNIITITGDCEVTLEYREIRKIGEI